MEDGLDVEAIDQAIQAAKLDPRPSLIMVRTIIGYGLPTRAGTAKAHGEPPGEVELNGAKEKLGWPIEPHFHIPAESLAFFRQALTKGTGWEAVWREQIASYRAAYPELAAELERRLEGRLPVDWQSTLTPFPPDEKGLATRAASGKVLNALASVLPELVGGRVQNASAA